ncbi:MAG: 50S ribosomal protein L23 [Ardenticatenaceae bacterium]|nr:50S ribosomal protein L23 [Anaerolineales bacterium]MCB8922602.1 50S ribosomal protein L23 [Ardenticatenaceae bacterium]MCB8991270.1 50S ribosomal protein L23 [Ardenticatenaceae bacterium]MCB9003689.1 50S ribosomal protein L23 [Ardenticatenaceae bacterium]
MHWREIIRRPVVTEKSNFMADELNQYTFVVDSRANKVQIKQAVELAWPDVTVEKVRVSNMPAKRARRWRSMTTRKVGWKKAIVTLAWGDSIDLFEGV